MTREQAIREHRRTWRCLQNSMRRLISRMAMLLVFMLRSDNIYLLENIKRFGRIVFAVNMLHILILLVVSVLLYGIITIIVQMENLVLLLI